MAKQVKSLEKELSSKKIKEGQLQRELEVCKKELHKQKESAKRRRKSVTDDQFKSREHSRGRMNAQFRKTIDTVGKKVEINIMENEENSFVKPSHNSGNKSEDRGRVLN